MQETLVCFVDSVYHFQLILSLDILDGRKGSFSVWCSDGCFLSRCPLYQYIKFISPLHPSFVPNSNREDRQYVCAFMFFTLIQWVSPFSSFGPSTSIIVYFGILNDLTFICFLQSNGPCVYDYQGAQLPSCDSIMTWNAWCGCHSQCLVLLWIW